MSQPDTPTRPGPIPNPVTSRFWEEAARERLMLQHCQRCAQWVFFPRRRCPACWSDALEWQESTGHGHIASFTVVYHPEHPAFAQDVPYVVALIDLVEGPRMLSNLVDSGPRNVRVGDAVTVTWRHHASHSLPQFRLVEGGNA